MRTITLIIIVLFASLAHAQSNDQTLLNQMLERMDSLQDEVTELRNKNERLQYEFTRFKERVLREIEDEAEQEDTEQARIGQESTPTETDLSEQPEESTEQADPVTRSTTIPQDREIVGDKKFNAVTSQSEYDAYRRSMKILQEGDYEQLRTALTNFLTNYPKGKYAADAKYWIAESYYASENYPSAKGYYIQVVKEHENHPRREDAMLKIAYIRESNQEWNKAALIFKILAEKANNQKIRSLAKLRLRRLEKRNR